MTRSPWWICLVALIQLADIPGAVSIELTPASDWGECSRSCGAGVSQKRCQGRCPAGGDSVEYRTCNTQRCPEGSVDFRAQQCATFNRLRHAGALFRWLPAPAVSAVDDSRCSLRCRSAEDATVVAVLAERVLDGTPCDQHSNDVCIGGKCVPVGCDFRLWSTEHVDRCGVCGGDGAGCDVTSAAADVTSASAAFVWKLVQSSACSVTCGIGRRLAMLVCLNSMTQSVVKNASCDGLSELEMSRQSATCWRGECEPDWAVGLWSACSVSCGGGQTKRSVVCGVTRHTGRTSRANDALCARAKPEADRRCKQEVCPEWRAGEWSQCSVTCGIGVQHRHVVCRHTKQFSCSLLESPARSRECLAAVPCPSRASYESAGDGRSDGRGSVYASKSEWSSDEPDGVKGLRSSEEVRERELPEDDGWDWIEYGEDDDDVRDDDDDDEEEEDDGGDDYHDEVDDSDRDDASSNMFPYEEIGGRKGNGYEASGGGGFGTSAQVWFPLEEEDTEEFRARRKSLSPSYYTTGWSHCTTTCGQGVRFRTVQCRGHADSTEQLPDHKCSDEKPAQNETCTDRPCGNLTTDDDKHQWRVTGYSPCSKSCLGGFQETVHVCIRLRDARPITDSTCADLPKPNITRQVCNAIACPPRWHLEEYGECSMTCGSGNQARLIKCLQAVKSTNQQTDSVLVPDANCPRPPPFSVRACNLVDCPPAWTVDKWTQCSVTCGDGVQRRTVACRLRTATGKWRPADGCDTATVPTTAQACVVRLPCPTATSPHARPLSTHVLAFVQTARRKRVLFNARGRATVIPGTHLIVQCPLAKFASNPRQIQWRRHNRRVPRSGRARARRRGWRVYASRRGQLHIDKSRYSDARLYRCSLNGATDNVTLTLYSVGEAARRRRVRRQYVAGNSAFYRRLRADDKKRAVRHRKGYTFGNLLRHHNVSSLPFYFLEGEWSACSASCGGGGLQQREITCELNLRRYYLVVEDAYCERRATLKPLETRDCGFHTCARWKEGRWLKCEHDRCLRKGVATIRRPLSCISDDGREMKPHHCEPRDMPEHIRECPSQYCDAKWIPGEWTQCSRICGGQGIRSRSIQCVWTSKYGKQYPAGAHCADLPRPGTSKVCQTPPCTMAACRDESDFCSLVPMLNLCRYDQYRRKCCRSCYYKLYRP